MGDIIVAVATPRGRGALAVVRATGAGSIALASRLFRPKTAPGEFQERCVYFGDIFHGGEFIDRVGLVVYRAPRSYTGEDMVEITCHGGPLTPGLIAEGFLAEGARAAEPGEFTLRAYLNGKMSLAEAEAVDAISRALTKRAHAGATERLRDKTPEVLGEFRDRLSGLLSETEARLDFPEDVPDPDPGALAREIAALSSDMQSFLNASSRAEPLLDGVKVVLAGAPNAGKSTLFNALVGCERAIVHPAPGTTRDYIAETVEINGILVRLYDTAGLAEFPGALDAEGVKRAVSLVEQADIVVYLVEAPSETWEWPLRENTLRVLSKADLLTRQAPGGVLPVSGLTGAGLDALLREISLRAGELIGEGKPLFSRERDALREAIGALSRAGEAGLGLEIVAHHLWSAARALGRALGEGLSEEVLRGIFSRFCLGK